MTLPFRHTAAALSVFLIACAVLAPVSPATPYRDAPFLA